MSIRVTQLRSSSSNSERSAYSFHHYIRHNFMAQERFEMLKIPRLTDNESGDGDGNCDDIDSCQLWSARLPASSKHSTRVFYVLIPEIGEIAGLTAVAAVAAAAVALSTLNCDKNDDINDNDNESSINVREREKLPKCRAFSIGIHHFLGFCALLVQ